MSGLNLTPAMLAVSQGNAQARLADAASAKALAKPAAGEKDPALWEASLKFEAMLMQQMMAAMRKTVPESGLISSGFANDMYNSMFDQAIAETGSTRGSLGIAEGIYRQMSAAAGINENPESADKVNTGGHAARSEE